MLLHAGNRSVVSYENCTLIARKICRQVIRAGNCSSEAREVGIGKVKARFRYYHFSVLRTRRLEFVTEYEMKVCHNGLGNPSTRLFLNRKNAILDVFTVRLSLIW